MCLEQAPRAMVVLGHFTKPPPPWLHFLRLTLWAQAISGVGRRVVWGHLCPPTAVPCPHDAFQPPVGKSGPEDYLSRPGSGEDSSGMGALTSAHCCFSPLEISYFLLPTYPIPHGPQKHTLTTPTPGLCFASSLDPEAAMDIVSIQGLM